MRELQAAAVARAESVWLADRVHEVGAVPDVPATPYLVLSVTAPGDTNGRSGGRSGSRSAWVVVQAVGKTAGEVAFAIEKADAAYLGHRLTVAGSDVRRATRGDPSTIYRDPDAGVLLTCTLIYRLTYTPQGAPA